MVFRDGQSNGVIQFCHGFSLIAMATKFGTKWAITRSVRDICEIFASIAGIMGWIPSLYLTWAWISTGSWWTGI